MQMMSDAKLREVLTKAYQAGYDQREAEYTGFDHGEIKPGTLAAQEQRIKVEQLFREASS